MDEVTEKKRVKVRQILKSLYSNTGHILFLVAMVTIIIFAIINWGSTMTIVGHFLSVVAPFIVGFFISYIIKPMVRFFEKILDKIKKGKLIKLKMIIGVILSYIIGKYFGLGLLGVNISMVIDWCFRSIMFSTRWLKGKWMTKKVI